jgi:hypothetical protein
MKAAKFSSVQHAESTLKAQNSTETSVCIVPAMTGPLK